MSSAKLLSDYRKALSTVADTAGQTLKRTYANLVARGFTEEVLRDGMLDAAVAVTSELGNLASVAAADFYELSRFEGLPGLVDFEARLADLPDFKVIEKQVHMSARFLFDRKGIQGRVYAADADMFLRELAANIERMILDAARDTILASALDDPLPPRVAVIARPGACDFCRSAADEGWMVPNRANRLSGIFHDHCRCFAAPSWDHGPIRETSSRPFG